MQPHSYDLVVIGSGPAGQKGAICAAKLGKSVAIVDKRAMLGGVSVHTGTIPSKTLREAILHLTGLRQRSFYGADYVVKERITMADLRQRLDAVVRREMEVVAAQLKRNGVHVLGGHARFLDPHTLSVEGDGEPLIVHAHHVLVACGTRPATNPAIPVDGRGIFLTDQLVGLEELPHELVVVGAGVIGLEYASMFSAMGIRCTVLDQRPRVLEFCDHEVVEHLMVRLRAQGTTFRLGETVKHVGRDAKGRVEAETESGKKIHGDGLLYAVGRQVNTDNLGLEQAGLAVDARGRLKVDGAFKTEVPHICAAGDVIGFPSLASTSMEQGRNAVNCLFESESCRALSSLPYGIYTIPEISMVGRTEEELTAAKTPYETGMARYAELAKGMMVGAEDGFLKLLFDPTTLRVHGVHAIGEQAAEIVHIGQAVMALGGTLDYFRDTVFNYPTFAEAYKVAALDGFNKL
jgi:NAD(P) transhydrogenase